MAAHLLLLEVVRCPVVGNRPIAAGLAPGLKPLHRPQRIQGLLRGCWSCPLGEGVPKLPAAEIPERLRQPARAVLLAVHREEESNRRAHALRTSSGDEAVLLGFPCSVQVVVEHDDGRRTWGCRGGRAVQWLGVASQPMDEGGLQAKLMAAMLRIAPHLLGRWVAVPLAIVSDEDHASLIRLGRGFLQVELLEVFELCFAHGVCVCEVTQMPILAPVDVEPERLASVVIQQLFDAALLVVVGHEQLWDV
eukprot:CAMPEP_0181468082 /NCGR_PEP_ID=MMETSP1110-20121109/37310_1 /TAXON_ID=174948 /ORGANISM="Symbiodinium sp., Strain CCMP421" /LENGTH=248 /DNA_ID=CAMNT_0023592927 /DNA_START=82 /DNA_END=828 /DNA_ORIENTATION=+